MAALTIGWEYLTGYAVATDPSSRNRVEWPPHPARVFMALAAAWFETAEEPDEGEALRWLEALGDPEMHLPPHEPGFERSLVTVYVPVNDKADAHHRPDKKKKAKLFPKLGDVLIGRNRQARTFPRIRVGFEPCHLHWPNAPGVEEHREALDRLCRKVTRIGHSSSLVRMWVVGEDDPAPGASESWVPDDALAAAQTRQTSAGMLDMLIERYGEAPRQRRRELTEQIASLKAEKKTIRGKGAARRKALVDEKVTDLQQELDVTIDRPPVRPSIGLWSGYRRQSAGPSVDESTAEPHFDTDLLVLKHVGGPTLPLVSTLGVTCALRDTLMRHSGVQPAPAWVCGHQPNGAPLREEGGHLAIMPLPFVGRKHADGHLLGVALVFPRGVGRRERGRVLGQALMDDNGQPKRIGLKLGRRGVWVVQKRDWSEQRWALQPETWTAHAKGADTWASVTPVVLDRFPKQDRVKNRADWSAEVAEIIREACARIGLPRPVGVDIDTTSWHIGSPRAVVKHRRPREEAPVGPQHIASLGDGFPFYPAKGTNASRPQVHAWLRFTEPVVGPILLGAGRYRGYGLFKPWKGGQS